MAASLYSTATEYVANAITMHRGSVADITSVGVYFSLDPITVPTVANFTTVQLVQPGDPLAQGTSTDVLTLVGPRGDVTLAPGDYQVWVLITTLTEDIIRRVDVLEVK